MGADVLVVDDRRDRVESDLRDELSRSRGRNWGPGHFEKIESAHDRIERLIEDLLTLACGETTVEDTEQITLETVAREAWGYVDTSAATIDVAEELPVVAGDASRLGQLFETSSGMLSNTAART